MRKVLITGVSGVGKSTVLGEFEALGFETVDTDYGGWFVPPEDGGSPVGPTQPDWIWDAARMHDLLTANVDGVLFVGGCVENQGEFYPYFDEVVLLTAEPQTIADRLAARDTNPYGKGPGESERVLEDQRTFEPVLRRRATIVIDTDAPLDSVVSSILQRIGSSIEASGPLDT